MEKHIPDKRYKAFIVRKLCVSAQKSPKIWPQMVYPKYILKWQKEPHSSVLFVILKKKKMRYMSPQQIREIFCDVSTKNFILILYI